jgi:transcriptional regulator with XRE-family HTH domain
MKTMTQKKHDLAKFLERMQLKISLQVNKVMDQGDFANYLEVTQPTLSSWMTGMRLPVGRNVEILADKLGYEVYDVLEERWRIDPDENFQRLLRVWIDMTPDERQHFASLIEKETQEKRQKGGAGARSLPVTST